MKLQSDVYMLRSSLPSNTLGEPSYLVALSNSATRTVFMKVIDYSSACPKGYNFHANIWTMDPRDGVGADEVFANFRFAGFKCRWEAVKDAAPEGWRLY